MSTEKKFEGWKPRGWVEKETDPATELSNQQYGLLACVARTGSLEFREKYRQDPEVVAALNEHGKNILDVLCADASDASVGDAASREEACRILRACGQREEMAQREKTYGQNRQIEC